MISNVFSKHYFVGQRCVYCNLDFYNSEDNDDCINREEPVAYSTNSDSSRSCNYDYYEDRKDF